MQYRGDIDGLRAVAVGAVVVFHIAPGALPGGFVGVDVFFVISGYLLTGIVWGLQVRGAFSFAEFYARRARRLLPALYVTLAATLVSSAALLPAAEARGAALSAVAAVASASNFRFAAQAGYFDDDAYRKPLLHTWSLAVEEQFYLVWPLALALVFRFRVRLLPALFIPVFLASVALSEAAARARPAAAYFLVPFRVYQFLAGAGLHLVGAPTSVAAEELLASAGAAALAVSLALFSERTRFPGLAGLVPTLGAALLLHCPKSTAGALLAAPALRGLGRLSYSVYLVHWPVIVTHSILSPNARAPECAAFLIAASLALGYALHHSVEQRFRHAAPTPPDPAVTKATDTPRATLLCFARVGSVLCLLALGTSTLAGGRASQRAAFHAGAASRRAAARAPGRDVVRGFNLSRAARWVERLSVGREPGVREYGSAEYNFHVSFVPPRVRRSAARVLLIGDSHARYLHPLLLREAVERGTRLDLYKRRGCAPLFNLSHPYAPCRSTQLGWARLVAAAPYDVVVLVARWMYLFEDENYAAHAVRRSGALLRPGERYVPPASTCRARFQEKIEETVREITRSGAHAVLVAQPPHLGRSTRGCLQFPAARVALREHAQPAACVAVDRQDALKRARFMDNVFARLAARDERITVLPSTEYFCDNWRDTSCRAVFAGRELYIDENHPSLFGSIFLGERWKVDNYSGLDWGFRNPAARNPSRATNILGKDWLDSTEE